VAEVQMPDGRLVEVRCSMKIYPSGQCIPSVWIRWPKNWNPQ